MDRFSKTCLFLIVLLLAVIALRPIVTPQPVRAAQVWEYDAFDSSGREVVNGLNEASRKGWDIFSIVHVNDIVGWSIIVRRPAGSAATPATKK
jgi:hypothetical protein